jgi:multicomponent Na+:H+ antiporter subunit A
VLLYALLVMVAATLAAPLLARTLGRNTGYVLAAAFMTAAVLLLVEAPGVVAGSTKTQSWSWVPSLGVDFILRLNGLALLFALLVLGVGTLVLSYAPRYLKPDFDHGWLYATLGVFATSMLLLVLAGDIIVLLVSWEITTICSFLLVAGRGLKGKRPAIQALFVTAFGGLALLGASVLLIARIGSTNLTTIITQGPGTLTEVDYAIIGPLIVVAAFTKSAQLPFHFWLPGAMVAITPVSAYLHAATLVKAGIYLLLLFSPLFSAVPGWHLTLMAVGLATTLFGAYQALRQDDLKSLLAYSTVSQLGIMVALVGVGTSAALAAAVLLVAAHALFKATLFMLVGIIDREAGSRDIRELGGLWRAMPITAFLTALAAMSMAGFPPLVGFVAKEEAFYSFLGTGDAEWALGADWAGYAAVAIAVLGAALTFAYSARIVIGAFAGPLRQTALYEPAWAFLAPAAVSALLGLVLGLAPGLLDGLVSRATIDTGFTPTAGGLSLWHGFSIALGLSAIAISLGLLIHLQRHRLGRVIPHDVPTAVAPVIFDHLWDRAIEVGARIGRSAHRSSVGPHLIGVLVLLVALGGWSLTLVGTLPSMIPGTVQPPDLVVAAVLLPTIVLLALSRKPIAALVLTGIIGLTIAVWLLLLGAPDVALTLLLVEILTVVVAAPVLARLPSRQPQVHGRTGAMAMAATAGLVTGGLAWMMTGRREPGLVSEYFLTQGEELTGGANVVNTILVDFRGLDTLGEVVVLAAAASGLLAAVGAGTGLLRGHRSDVLGAGERAVLRVGAVAVLPIIIIVAIALFWRGHDEPGGGFIAGLVGGAALAVARIARMPFPMPSVKALVSSGLVLAVGTGLAGLLVAGAFLEPFPITMPWGYVTSSLFFDLGVFLIVIGLVRAAIDHLGSQPSEVVRRDTGRGDAGHDDAGRDDVDVTT